MWLEGRFCAIVYPVCPFLSGGQPAEKMPLRYLGELKNTWVNVLFLKFKSYAFYKNTKVFIVFRTDVLVRGQSLLFSQALGCVIDQ